MKSLTPNELIDLRKMLEGIDLPPHKQDEMIRILDNIASSWADRAYGAHSVQLSLSARANYKFSGIDAYATTKQSITLKSDPLTSEVDNITIGPEGHLTP